jgi:hypothetical protein
MKTNEFVASLKDLEVASRIKDVKEIMAGAGTITTGEMVDLIIPNASDEDKFRVAILVQNVISNMSAMMRGR